MVKRDWTAILAVVATAGALWATTLQGPPDDMRWTGHLTHIDKVAIDNYCENKYCPTDHHWVIVGPAQRVICSDTRCQVRQLPLRTPVHLVLYSDQSYGRVYLEEGGLVTISTDSVDATHLTCWCPTG